MLDAAGPASTRSALYPHLHKRTGYISSPWPHPSYIPPSVCVGVIGTGTVGTVHSDSRHHGFETIDCFVVRCAITVHICISCLVPQDYLRLMRSSS